MVLSGSESTAEFFEALLSSAVRTCEVGMVKVTM